jgi:hypothetical protein
MGKGMLSIFRKQEVSKGDDAPQSKLAKALYGAAPSRPAPPATALLPPPVTTTKRRAKLLFGFDATASREGAWATSTELTVALLAALPGELDVALAVHGGSKVHTVTPFVSDASKLRDRAAAVRCKAGGTRLLEMLARVLEYEGVGTVVYVGDVFEESKRRGLKLAAELAARNIRLIILHDTQAASYSADAKIFAEMTAITGGCVMPFDASALHKMRDLLSAVAVLTVGGTAMLAEKQATMPAARLLLQHLKGDKR